MPAILSRSGPISASYPAHRASAAAFRALDRLVLLDHVQRGAPGHHAVDLALRRARPQVHAGLPAQPRRRVEVAPLVGLDGPDREAPVVDPLGESAAFERLVDLLRPGRAGVSKPVRRHHRPRLAGAAGRRVLRVVPLEPLRRRPLDAVVRPLADDQVRVRVPPAAPVDRQCVGQPLGRGQAPGKQSRKGSLAPLGQLLRERELHLAVHPPVRPKSGRSSGRPSRTGARTSRHGMRRVKARISTQERRQRTRRLILIGTLVERELAENPNRRTRFNSRLDAFLTRDRDRELFGLKPQEGGGAETSSPPETSAAEEPDDAKEPDDEPTNQPEGGRRGD